MAAAGEEVSDTFKGSDNYKEYQYNILCLNLYNIFRFNLDEDFSSSLPF